MASRGRRLGRGGSHADHGGSHSNQGTGSHSEDHDAHIMSPFMHTSSPHIDADVIGTSTRASETDSSSIQRVGIYEKAQGGKEFSSSATSNAIREGVLARITDFWPRFSSIPDDVKKVMFTDFMGKFAWKEDVSEEMIKKVWMTKASHKYREWTYSMRSKRKMHTSIAQEIYDKFLAYWETEDFKEKSEKNSEIRRRNPKLHCGGSRSYADYRNDMYSEHHSEATAWEVYCRTHKIESEEGSTANSWVDDASSEFATMYQTKIDELQSQRVEITNKLSEDVFNGLSASITKRQDRKPYYGNIPTKSRVRDATHVEDLEKIQLRAEVKELKEQYTRLENIVTQHIQNNEPRDAGGDK